MKKWEFKEKWELRRMTKNRVTRLDSEKYGISSKCPLFVLDFKWKFFRKILDLSQNKETCPLKDYVLATLLETDQDRDMKTHIPPEITLIETPEVDPPLHPPWLLQSTESSLSNPHSISIEHFKVFSPLYCSHKTIFRACKMSKYRFTRYSNWIEIEMLDFSSFSIFFPPFSNWICFWIKRKKIYRQSWIDMIDCKTFFKKKKWKKR